MLRKFTQETESPDRILPHWSTFWECVCSWVGVCDLQTHWLVDVRAGDQWDLRGSCSTQTTTLFIAGFRTEAFTAAAPDTERHGGNLDPILDLKKQQRDPVINKRIQSSVEIYMWRDLQCKVGCMRLFYSKRRIFLLTLFTVLHCGCIIIQYGLAPKQLNCFFLKMWSHMNFNELEI